MTIQDLKIGGSETVIMNISCVFFLNYLTNFDFWWFLFIFEGDGCFHCFIIYQNELH